MKLGQTRLIVFVEPFHGRQFDVCRFVGGIHFDGVPQVAETEAVVAVVEMGEGVVIVQGRVLDALPLELIEQVNAMLTPGADIAVVGASMGGLIGRYSLAYMEQNAIEHNVRTFISFDSPQKSANIPLGIQYWIKLFSIESAEADTMLQALARPAPRQMLAYYLTYQLAMEAEVPLVMFLLLLFVAFFLFPWKKLCDRWNKGPAYGLGLIIGGLAVAATFFLPHQPTGRPLKVVRIDGGRALTAHLADLGISVGAVVKVVRVGPFGPVMVRVGDSRYAIGRGAAMKIWAVEHGA